MQQDWLIYQLCDAFGKQAGNSTEQSEQADVPNINFSSTELCNVKKRQATDIAVLLPHQLQQSL